MQVPPQVDYKDVQATPELDGLITRQISKLEQVCDYITSVHIIVERVAQRHRSGNPYRVRIDTRVPPKHELAAKRVSVTGTWEEPLPAVVRRAFEKARRQLQKLVEEQRGEVKTHPTSQTTAFVNKLFREEGYGFLTTIDGENVYFHKNSVLHNHWDSLVVGAGVRHVAEMGEKGPQATTVELVDKPGARELHGELHPI